MSEMHKKPGQWNFSDFNKINAFREEIPEEKRKLVQDAGAYNRIIEGFLKEVSSKRKPCLEKTVEDGRFVVFGTEIDLNTYPFTATGEKHVADNNMYKSITGLLQPLYSLILEKMGEIKMEYDFIIPNAVLTYAKNKTKKLPRVTKLSIYCQKKFHYGIVLPSAGKELYQIHDGKVVVASGVIENEIKEIKKL